MTRVIESLLLIEFQIFVKFDPGQKSGSFIKFPRAQQPITFLWKEKRKKKRGERGGAFQKRKKFARPDGGRRPPPRSSQFSLFNREAASWSRLFFLVTRLARGAMRGRGEHAPRGKTWKLAAFSSHPRELFRAVHRSNATGAASWLEGEYETGNDGFGPPRTRPSGWKFILSDAETSFRLVVLFFFKNSSLISVDLFNFSTMHDCPTIFFNNNSTIRVCKFYMYIFFYNSWSSSL